MIKQRQVYQSIIVEYIDTPVISVAIDGTSVISSLTLPEQTVRQTRIIALPETAIGFIPQFSSTNTSDIRHQFVGIPEDQFKDQQLFQYYEVTFKGSVRFNLFLDQVALKPNLSIKSYVDLSVRESRVQDTRKYSFLHCHMDTFLTSHKQSIIQTMVRL